MKKTIAAIVLKSGKKLVLSRTTKYQIIKWTRFMDMRSGGRQKEKWSHIYIEASEQEAKVIFYNRFGHNPDKVTCTCCGNDYSINEEVSLEQATAFERNCKWNEEANCYSEEQGIKFTYSAYEPLDKYIAHKTVLVIPASDIKPNERKGNIPAQGYVWVG